MNRMFYRCYSLSSLDLSNFITSNVQIFYQMFYQCKSLTSLDLSNFNTVKLSNMTDMFKECNKLEYLNLKNFKNGLVVLENDFYNTPENIVICTDSDSILSHINSHKKCRTVTCDENWKEHQQKINTENDECTNDCLNVNYKYLYGSKCINNCPERTIENNYICEDCHEDCKICTDKYSDNNSNCITCLDENKFINFGNCVSNCKNDYYNYYNETLDLTIKTCKCDLENCFQCTQESLNNNNSCISCNIQKGYYPIENDIYNNNFIKCYNSPDGFYLDMENLLYKKCFHSCKECNKGGNESYHNCLKCKEDYKYEIQFDNYTNCYSSYLDCPYFYYFDMNEQEYYCTQNLKCEGVYDKLIIGTKECANECNKITKYKFRNQCYSDCPEGSIKSLNISFNCEIICEENEPFEIINEQICVNDCSLNLIKKKLCKMKYQKIKPKENSENNNEENNKNEEVKAQNIILDNYEKGFTSEEYNTSEIDQGQDDVYEEKDMTVTFSNLENQKKKENEKNNFTSIHFGDCETKLREYYNIPENKLFYTKTLEIQIPGMKIPKIEYEVYCKLNDSNLVQLNKSICNDTKIDIILPVKLDEEINKLNSSSGYYNDICYTTTSDSGTDITLKDRKKEFVENNKTLCQENCLFSKYNYETQKAYCSCKVEQTSHSFADMHIDTNLLYNNFIDFKNIANIKILTCYNSLFNKKSIKKNIGFFISIIIIIFHIICAVILYKKEWGLLTLKIDDILVSKQNLNLYQYQKEKEGTLNKTKKNNSTKKNKEYSINDHNKVIIIPNLIYNNNYILTNNIEQDIADSQSQTRNKAKLKNNIIKSDNSKEGKDNIQKQNSNDNLKNYNSLEAHKIIKISKEIMEYNDVELNNLSYNLSLKYDKRAYMQYFISLLKTKHILFFSFFYKSDYNSKIVKKNLFFIGFILSYAVNALFFNDETMHKIYEDKGTLILYINFRKIFIHF